MALNNFLSQMTNTKDGSKQRITMLNTYPKKIIRAATEAHARA
jgi:hypothetical protein